MKRKFLITLIFVSVYSLCFSQNNSITKDSIIYEKYIKKLTKYNHKPTNELLVLSGKFFIGSPYVSGTLEKNKEEQLTINLREFDCTTLVENAIALTQELQKGDKGSFENYRANLQRIRYRGGDIQGYASRLHYVSEWIEDNNQIIENITLQLGGEAITKPLNFMSSKPHLYAALKGDKNQIEKIREIEQIINQKSCYTLISKSKIKEIEHKIETGDIIVFGTNVPGLDYSHIGIALWDGEILKLLHASSAKKEVIIDVKPLVQYCMQSKTCSGITVLRLK